MESDNIQSSLPSSRQPLTQPAANLALALFQKQFGHPATLLSFSPGRVNLIGEHTDYNDGIVMPFAIGQGIYVAARRSTEDSGMAEIFTDARNQSSACFSLIQQVAKGEPAWSSYVRGVAEGLLAAGLKIPGFQAFIYGDLPSGGGLSSSAALEVSTALVMQALAEQETLDPRQLALLCQRAEHDYAGTPCGIMDQFAVIFGKKGHILQLDCRSQALKAVPLAEGAPKLLVINSNVKHALSDGNYKLRRQSCEAAAAELGLTALRDATLPMVASLTDPVTQIRARHVVTENARCEEAAEALSQGDWPRMGQLLYASHASLRDDYSVSCQELDLIVNIASNIGLAGGVYGCRMTGGGFGGCCVALVAPDQVDIVAQTISRNYQLETGIAPMVFVAEPSDGARLLILE